MRCKRSGDSKMLKFKLGEYVQDKQANIYQVIEVDRHSEFMPYLLQAIKRATDDITKTSPSSYNDHFGFVRPGDTQWIYEYPEADYLDNRESEFLTAEDLELAEPLNPKLYQDVRYFKNEIYQDDNGNEFTVLEDCTFGESFCKVRLTKRVSESVYVGNCLYEDIYGFALCTVSRKMRSYVDNEDEVFMDELLPIKLEGNKRIIQNTKPEDQKEAKSKLLALVKQMQTAEELAPTDKSFKERMKQTATKVKVQEVLEKVEQAANRGEFKIFVKDAGEVKRELEAYGLSVYGDIVGWVHND